MSHSHMLIYNNRSNVSNLSYYLISILINHNHVLLDYTTPISLHIPSFHSSSTTLLPLHLYFPMPIHHHIFIHCFYNLLLILIFFFLFVLPTTLIPLYFPSVMHITVPLLYILILSHFLTTNLIFLYFLLHLSLYLYILIPYFHFLSIFLTHIYPLLLMLCLYPFFTALSINLYIFFLLINNTL